jgi:hypothetical protein
MTSLKKTNVATDPETGWPFYALHIMGSNLVREYFLVSNYKRCIKHAANYRSVTERTIGIIEKTQGAFPNKTQLLAGAKEITDWVAKMEEDNYHELYVNSFIGMWSSFEAGIENVIADFLANDRNVASRAFQSLKRPPLRMEDWPWGKEECLDATHVLERAANRSANAEWWDVYQRISKLFSLIGVSLCIEDQKQNDLAEANMVRNIILHRYGHLGAREVEAFPHLSQWAGRVVPFNEERFSRYYMAIVAVITGLLTSISATHSVRKDDA